MEDKMREYYNARDIANMSREEREVRYLHLEMYEFLREAGWWVQNPKRLIFEETRERFVLRETLTSPSSERMESIISAVLTSRPTSTPSEKASASSAEPSKYQRIIRLLQSDKQTRDIFSYKLLKLYEELTSYTYLYQALDLLYLFEQKLYFEDCDETPVETKPDDKVVTVLHSGKDSGKEVSSSVLGDPLAMVAVKSEYALKDIKVDFSHDSEVLECEESREYLTERDEACEYLPEREEARNDLESYTLSLKMQVSTLEKAIEGKIKWLEENQGADTQDFQAQKKELEDIVQPVVTKLYQVSIGAPAPPSSESDDLKKDADTEDFEGQKKKALSPVAEKKDEGSVEAMKKLVESPEVEEKLLESARAEKKEVEEDEEKKDDD